MRVSVRMFNNMVKQIAQDFMMAMLIPMPILIGLLFKLGIPLLERTILVTYGFENVIVPYYELFSWLLALLCGMLFAFVGGLVILGEFDERVAKYIIVTPVGLKGYLFSRIGIPAIVSGIVSMVCIPIFALCTISLEKLLVMVSATVLSGVVTALLVVAISTNKVEGMAVGKLSGLFGAMFFVPLFVKGGIKYVFFIFPMYHIGEWMLDSRGYSLLIAAFLYVIWIYVLGVRFQKKFV